MTGNITYLLDLKDFDGGYVTFGRGAYGDRITGKVDIPWVFLTTKDETSEILKIVIKEVENLVDKKVKILRSDNGTEFKNKVMDDFCREKSIKREYSVARTPQQNSVAKRKNRTLIEAARTMLADSKLPTTFWAKAVSTACYVQNRVLIVKPHNKTPYELFRGFKPAIGFMKPFGCHVTILNTLDNLGKFDGKSDEYFFVGYSLSSKARTKRVSKALVPPAWVEAMQGTSPFKHAKENPPMIGSLMYLTASRPDIMFAVCACSRFQVSPKTSHLLAVKRIFRYLKGKPSLGLWYSKDSLLELVAYTDSDYTGDTQDRKSTTRVAVDSTIRIIENPVQHSKTKHIEIRHHFIRDCNAKELIQMVKIDTEHNVANLLTKGFDASRFQYLVSTLASPEQTATAMASPKQTAIGKDSSNPFMAGSLPKTTLMCEFLLLMASLDFCDKHNMVAFLEKSTGSAGFHQIIDFLNQSHICYALTKKPEVCVSFIKQFWRSAEASTDENGDVKINATIDGYTLSITEGSLRRHLKLADQDGITSIPTTEIFEQLALMGYHTDSDKLTFQKGAFSPQWRFLIHNILHCLSPKKTAWEQFSSNIAAAVICLATNRKFNFSRMIFEHMVSNITSPHKFLMYPRPTKGYSGQEVALFPTMLNVSEPSTSPSRITSSPSPSPEPSPSHSPEPSTKHSPDHTTAAGSLKLIELLNLVTKLSKRIGILEDDLKKTKLTYSAIVNKLILRVKKLEFQVKTRKTRKRARVVLSEDDKDIEDDSSKQGRKSDVEVKGKASTKTEPIIQKVTPTEVIQDQESSEKGNSKVSTAGATKCTASEVPVISTTEENISTAEENISTLEELLLTEEGVKRKG
ncbi:putative ribonuclease H-like domain-containing protein [Tanacetum coccineum]